MSAHRDGLRRRRPFFLPAPFDTLCLNDMASLIDRLCVLAGTPAAADKPLNGKRLTYSAASADQERTVADFAQQAHCAHEVLQGWPHAFEDVLASLCLRNASPVTEHRAHRLFATRVGALLSTFCAMSMVVRSES